MKPNKRVLLVGAGHAHVEVLRSWALRPPAHADLTLLVDRERSVYSGMVPGFVAGMYALADLEIDAAMLAARAGARLVLAAATRVDGRQRIVQTSEGEELHYDLASLDVGSTVAGLDVPGVAENALATRPIHEFVARIETLRARAATGASRIVVVGAGAGGVELACCLRADHARVAPAVCLLDVADRPLPGAAPEFSRRIGAAMKLRGIEWRGGARVEAVEPTAVRLKGGERLRADAVVWTTGAAPHEFLRESDLKKDGRGFVRVGPTWQVDGYPELFALGDCAGRADVPDLPKAGVHAVRAGPVLWRNLQAALHGRPAREQRPQSDFLSLLNLGDGSALGAKWGLLFEGRWVMRLKDAIDRRFIARYR